MNEVQMPNSSPFASMMRKDPKKTAAAKKQFEGMNAGQIEEWIYKNPFAAQDIKKMAQGYKKQAQQALTTQAQTQMADYASTHPGVIRSTQSVAEQRAGVNAPDYEGVRDVQTGELLSQYAFDPTKSEAFQKQREQAMSTGPSAWAQLQTQKQKMEEANQRDMAARQAQQGMSQAASSLARTGGLGGGARTRMAMQGAKDLMLQGQGISRQGMSDRLGISSQDEQTRQGLLGQVAGTELQGQQTNLGTLGTDITRKAAFDANRYNQQMGAWGAKQTADAQRAAGSGGGKK